MTYWDSAKYQEVPCPCERCRNRRFGMPKYGRDHGAGCVCPACTISYNEHNRKLTCPCADCEMHREAIYPPKKRETARRIRERKTVATVNFCERCNTMGKSSAMGSIQFWREPSARPQEPMELCPGCVGDLLTWLKADVVTDRPKSYTEPYTEPKSDPLASLSDQELATAYLARKATELARNELEG